MQSVARGLAGALDGRGDSFASAISAFGVFFGSGPGSCRLVGVERRKRLRLGVSGVGWAREIVAIDMSAPSAPVPR